MNSDRSALLARLLADEGIELGSPPRIVPRNHDGAAPLTFAQEVLWLVDRASAATGAYNVRLAYRITGELDERALSVALDGLIVRHEALRTTFVSGTEAGGQLVHAPQAVTLLRRDLTELPAEDRDDAALRFLQETATIPFDLTVDNPFRAALVRLSHREHMLLLVTHHIVADGWSCGVLMDDLSALYDSASGRAPAPPPPVLQFADFATWQRTAMPAADLEARLEYWRTRLHGLSPLELSADHRERGRTDAGARSSSTLPQALYSRVRTLAERRNVTLYMVLLAAWQTVLHRLSGQDDIVVGSPVAGRQSTETERLVGYFSQALPMRTSFHGDPTFAELLDRVADTVSGAFDHQDVPLEALALEAVRGGGRVAPLFRSVLTMRDPAKAVLRLGDARIEALSLGGDVTKFDLTLLAGQEEDEFGFTLWYRTELFERTTAERLLRQLERVLDAASADPQLHVSAMDLLSPDEHAELEYWNQTSTELEAGEPLHVRVAAHASAIPGAIALRCGEDALTYAQLEARASRIAHALRTKGVRRGMRVAIALDPSLDAIAAMLAVWKVGGAFVPLALDAPLERLRRQMLISEASAIIARPDFGAELRAGSIALIDPAFDGGLEPVEPNDPIEEDLLPELAYVIFTSGSTGTPKAVAVTHRNVANYAAAIAARLGATDATWTFATVSTLAADLGNTSIFGALFTGGTLRIIPSDCATDSVRFANAMVSPPVDVLKITPSHVRALLEGAPEGAQILPRRWLVCGGEALPWTLADVVSGSACSILNHYGPTEATVGACTFEVTAETAAAARTAGAQTVPIGKPLANVELHVLDAALAPVGVNVTGELYIAGAGVADGYLNRPDLTAERFIRLPGGQRAYRTGDRVRRLPSGDLVYLGRVDRQVKIRGFRVELAEIEATLNAYSTVAAAAVSLTEGDDARLVAYVVPASGAGEMFADSLREHVAAALPDYMVPATVVLLDEMPLTPNGKIDYAALPSVPAGKRAFVAARTPTERALATIWQQVFKRDQIGATDDFFALGGHSLLAIRVLGQIRRTFDVRLPVRTLLDAPTLEQLAALLDTEIALASLEALSEADADLTLAGDAVDSPLP